MNEDKVVGLRGGAVESPKAKQGVISLLEQLIARAREGEITSVCVVYVETEEGQQENVYRTSWDGSRFTLLGALGRAMHAINVSFDR